jgi:16S rRNA (guanine527-N7)-methyltransferase
MEAGRRSRQASVAAELTRGAGEFGIQLSADQIAAFDTYIETLVLWSSRLSLTAARSAHEITAANILDSLSVVPWIESASPAIADLGSGAGFPGVPVAIARPDVRLSLVEPRRKRANFLREVARRCCLANVVVVEERAENFAARAAESVDVTVSRAVWPLADFLAMSWVLLRSGGLAIAMKGPKVRTAVTLDERFLKPHLVSYTLPGAVEHILVIYRKR